MAGGKAVSMTTGQGTTGWATSHPPWGRLLSNEQVSSLCSGEKQAGTTQLVTGDWKERSILQYLGGRARLNPSHDQDWHPVTSSASQLPAGSTCIPSLGLLSLS